MSSKSKYPILDNRPIDQWKVTELKEELKRRKLTIKGLKEDLIKRLDEALRIERENAEETNGVDGDPPVTDSDNNEEHASVVSETTKETDEDANMIEKVDDGEVRVEKNDSTAAMDEGILQDGVSLTGSPKVEEGSAVQVTTLETKVTVTESVVSEVSLSVEGLQNIESKDNEDSKLQSEVEESKPQLDSEDRKPQLDSEDSKPQLESEDTKPQLDDVSMEPQVENENLKSQHADLVHDSSAPDNQVSEVSPVLGSQVRTDSISTDSVTINEMIELKENISADHVKLELDVKQEMVEPSSSIIVPDAGESHPMDVEEPPVNKNVEESPANKDVVESPVNKDVVEPFVKEDVEEKHDIKDMISDLHKKHDGEDVGLSEKLNLDRSSGDDSIEDAIENKTDSGNNPEEMGEKNVKVEGPISKEEKFADVAVRGSTVDKKSLDIENDVSSLPAEKRKLHDQAVVGNNESVKRQRRWNAENIKIPEPQHAAHTSTSNSKDISKDILQSTAPKRNFSRSDSTASEDPSKERVVPPSPKPPTNSLRIDRFLRPFTLKAVQELLGKTGSVTSFWMDHIKTHCYVTYSSVEEAMKTRDAVYNLQWPPNGGRLLIAEFVDPQEVKIRVEAPQTPTPAAVAPPVSTVPPPMQPEPSPRQPRQQHAPPPSHEENPLDNERRNELHKKWLEQQDAAGTEDLLQKLKYGSKLTKPALLEDENNEGENDDFEFGEAAAEDLLPVNVARMNIRKVKQMLPQMYTDKDDQYMSDDEETERRLARERVFDNAEGKSTFLSPAEDESTREVFGLIKKLNVVPDVKKRPKAQSFLDPPLTGVGKNTSSKSSFLGRSSNSSLSSSHKHGSSTNSRSFIFGRDDSNSRSAMAAMEESSEQGQSENKPTRISSAKFSYSQVRPSSQNTAPEIKSGSSLFDILRQSSLQLQRKPCTFGEESSQMSSAFASFKLEKTHMKKPIKTEGRF